MNTSKNVKKTPIMLEKKWAGYQPLLKEIDRILRYAKRPTKTIYSKRITKKLSR